MEYDGVNWTQEESVWRKKTLATVKQEVRLHYIKAFLKYGQVF